MWYMYSHLFWVGLELLVFIFTISYFFFIYIVTTILIRGESLNRHNSITNKTLTLCEASGNFVT